MIAIIVVTLAFVALDIYLIFNVVHMQFEVRENVKHISRFSRLEASIRVLGADFENLKLSGHSSESAKIWQTHYDDFQQKKSEALSVISQDEILIKQIRSADISVAQMNQIYYQRLQSFDDSLIMDTEASFRTEMNAAVDQVMNGVDHIRERVSELSESLTNHWNYLTILSLGSCLLAILLAITVYSHQKELVKRKVTERALHRITAEFRAIFKSIPDAVVFTDLHNEIMMVNPAFCELFGYKPAEVIGQHVLLLQSKEIYTGQNNYFVDLVEENSQKTAQEKIYQRKNGDWFLCETVTANVYDDGGNLFGHFSIVRDITRRKKTEKALQESENRNRAILEAIPDTIFRVSKEGVCLDYKASDLRDIGIAPDRIVGANISKFLGGRLGGRIKAAIGKALAEKRTQVVEYRMRAPKSKLRDYEARIAPGGKDEVLVIVRDITDRKNYERTMKIVQEKLERWVEKRTHDLVRANEEIKRFAYIVSHDLRAPLVNIKGFSGEMRDAFEVINQKLTKILPHLSEDDQRELREILQSEIPEALGFIDTAASRMGNLINSVLKLSRLGRRVMNFEEIDTKELVQKTLDSLAHQIEKEQVAVKIENLPEIIADRTSLEQIFSNILVNAINYLQPGRKGEITVTADETDDEVIFRIRDNGRGISPDDMDKVFEPFRRAGKSDVPGEGMGLAYVQRLVHKHGGRIWCISQLEIGSTFCFSIAKNLPEDPGKGIPEGNLQGVQSSVS